MLSASRKNYLTGLARAFHTRLDETTACYLASRGIDRRLAVRHGLGTVSDDPDHRSYWGMLCIPYATPTGVVALKFRNLEPGAEPKYTAPPGQRTRVFNARAVLRESHMIAICEGELDTIIAEDVLGIPAVGIPGVQNWKPHYRRLFEGYDTVLVLADNDAGKERNAGQEFADKLLSKLDNAQQVRLPAGQDVTDLVVSGGPDALRDLCGL